MKKVADLPQPFLRKGQVLNCIMPLDYVQIKEAAEFRSVSTCKKAADQTLGSGSETPFQR